jgi:hypothetical protein
MRQTALAQFATTVFGFELCVFFRRAIAVAFAMSFFVNVHF